MRKRRNSSRRRWMKEKRTLVKRQRRMLLGARAVRLRLRLRAEGKLVCLEASRICYTRKERRLRRITLGLGTLPSLLFNSQGRSTESIRLMEPVTRHWIPSIHLGEGFSMSSCKWASRRIRLQRTQISSSLTSNRRKRWPTRAKWMVQQAIERTDLHHLHYQIHRREASEHNR